MGAEDTKGKVGSEEELEDDDHLEDQEDEAIDEEEDEEGKHQKSAKQQKAGKTFSQSQVTRMMTREKKQGRDAAYREMGIDPKDKKMVSMFKAFIESQKSDDQKAAEAENQRNEELDKANQRALLAEAKAEAMMAGVKKQYVDDAVSLAMSKMNDDNDLASIFEEFKTKYSIWFGKSEEDDEDAGKKKGQRGTGSTVKSNGEGKVGKSKVSLGERLAAQRKASTNKKSFWS